MGVNSLPKTVTQQRRDCDLNPGPTAPESSMLTTRLPNHPYTKALPDWQRTSTTHYWYKATKQQCIHHVMCLLYASAWLSKHLRLLPFQNKLLINNTCRTTCWITPVINSITDTIQGVYKSSVTNFQEISKIHFNRKGLLSPEIVLILFTRGLPYVHTHTHTSLTALCPRLPGWAGTRKVKNNLDFTEARDSEWQWHQLGRMQVCTSIQTDNHASTPLVSFLQAGCPSCCPTNSVKILKAKSEPYKPSRKHIVCVNALNTTYRGPRLKDSLPLVPVPLLLLLLAALTLAQLAFTPS